MSIYQKYGIYGIVNKLNGKTYVGKTMKSFGDRWDSHKALLRGNYHDNQHLQNAWNKYGEENFDFVIIYDCCNGETLEDVNNLEIKYIKKYKEENRSYNIADGGDGGMFLGKHLPEETKRKIGEKNRINMTGKKFSDETKVKHSAIMKERYAQMSDEEREEVAERVRQLGYSNRGRIWSEESRNKMKDNKNGAKYDIEDVREIRRLHEIEDKGYTEISEITGIPRHTVYQIATYRRWKNAV